MKNTSYVQTNAEVQGVNQSRSYYVDMFADKLIGWGNITAASIVVDVPCGTGNMSAAMKGKGAGKKFYMVDINPTMVAAAEALLGKGGDVFIVADAAAIGSVVPPGVDTIMCLNGLHNYIDDQAAFLQGCHDILKAGGRFVVDVSTIGLNHKSRAYLERHNELIEKMAREHGSETNFPTYPDQKIIDDYTAMIKKSGLKIVDVVYVASMVPLAKYNESFVLIPGRLRPRLPQLSSDELRLKVFLDASEQAQRETGITEVKHTRVFYIAEK